MGAAALAGVIELVGRSSASGWVRVESAWLARHGLPVIELRRGNNVVSTGVLGALRPDLTKDGFNGYSFRIELSSVQQSELLSDDLSIVCTGQDGSVVLRRVAALDLAVRINAQSAETLVASQKFLLPSSRSILTTHKGGGALATNVRRQTAVITYANDDKAWFPYFLSYYGKMFGVENIFVVTPMPEAFDGLGLGGVWSVKGFPYDDGARANIMSSIANGCRNYYVWSIVCDVDEIIEPASRLGMSLCEYLSSCEDTVVYSRGLDVIQSDGEADFDFRRGVAEQRAFSIPNTALSKPHLAKADISYSGGYHFCSRFPEAASLRGDLVTYHMKWACSKVRSEVQASVMSTLYSDASIETYSRTSVDPEGQHPSLSRSSGHVVDVEGGAWDAFASENLADLQWDPGRGLYVGALVTAPFLVRLGG